MTTAWVVIEDSDAGPAVWLHQTQHGAMEYAASIRSEYDEVEWHRSPDHAALWTCHHATVQVIERPILTP